MKLHANARTCPNSRRLLVSRLEDEGWSVAAAAEAAGVSDRTAYRWLARWRAEGRSGLVDRSSRPRRSPGQLPGRLVEAIEKLRRVRMTAAQIAEVLGVALSTVSLWLKRIGLGKRSRLEPPEPPNRYERRHPGELVHVDIKTLGRISSRGAGHRMVANRKSQFTRREPGGKRRVKQTGFEYVHVMVDDHSRLAYAEVLPGLNTSCAVEFLRRAVGWFADRGVEIKAVMTDNGSCYVSHAHRQALIELAQAPSNQARSTANKRQGRALHPNPAQRMGLRTHLRQLHRAHSSPTPLPQPLQLPTTTRLPRQAATRDETDQPS